MKPSLGQQVRFGRPNGEKTLGEVIKVNRTRAKIRQLETRGTTRVRAEGTWNVPFSLIEAADDTDAEPKAPRSQDAIVSDLRNIESRLSPENLFCDGERPAAQARRIERQLNRQRAELVRELGREPSLGELYPSLAGR